MKAALATVQAGSSARRIRSSSAAARSRPRRRSVAQSGRSRRSRRHDELRLEGAGGTKPSRRRRARSNPGSSCTLAGARRLPLQSGGAACAARRFEYDALLVYEVGKSWVEADGDIAEAIDFLEFYAREALRYARPQPVVPLEGERNELVYIPLGVGAVIPPWNFAGAIMIGMTAAAIVCRQHGRAQALERCRDHCGVVRRSCCTRSACRRGVVNFVPGSGQRDRRRDRRRIREIRFISFTGSKEVGLRINELAAKPQPGQKWIKRVVAEMGGKDSIVVAADADLDAAVEGVAVSAFGFQGQKCSACSRAIVEESVYDEFVDKLRRARRHDHRRRSAGPGELHGAGRQRGCAATRSCDTSRRGTAKAA